MRDQDIPHARAPESLTAATHAASPLVDPCWEGMHVLGHAQVLWKLQAPQVAVEALVATH